MPEVSGTNAPHPKNGGTEIQKVYAQILPMIINEVFWEVILYFSGLLMVRNLWKDNTANVIMETVPKTKKYEL